MKLVCDGLDLSDAVNKVVKATAAKTLNPVLEGIKLTAKGDYLILTATDMDIFLEKKIRAEVFQEGEVVVKGKYFAEFVRKLDKEQIELSLIDDGKLNIKYTDAESSMPALSAEEFPVVNKELDKINFTLNQKELSDLIGKIIFSCSQDDARPLLKGCLFDIEGGILTGVALDGFRMALCRKHVECNAEKVAAVIPARSLSEIARLLEKEDEQVTVKIQDNSLMVEVDSTIIIARLLEGQFINYKQVIPSSFMTNITVNKQQLEDGIERASIVARGDKNNLIKLEIKEDYMCIKAETEIGSVNESILVNLAGRDLTIAFNSRYYSEALKAIDDEFIKIYFNTEVTPCIIKPCSGEDYTYLILPVRITA